MTPPVRERAPDGAPVRVTVLGSGDAYGSGGRGHSAYLVEGGGSTLLVDCGPTVLQSLKRIGRTTAPIDAVLLSHLHGDHFGGLPFLLLEYRYEAPRTRPLAIVGPADTERRTRGLFSALYEQTAADPLPFATDFQEVTPGRPVTVGAARITPVAVPHVPDLVCLSLRIEIAGRIILYSGDSAWTDDFITLARGVDLFLCECSTWETRIPIHIAYPEIAARAADLDCRVVLTHLGREPLERLGEISLEVAADGMTIDL